MPELSLFYFAAERLLAFSRHFLLVVLGSSLVFKLARLDIREETQQETRDATLVLVRVAAEQELHLASLHKRFQQECSATLTADSDEGLEVAGVWQERWLKQQC